MSESLAVSMIAPLESLGRSLLDVVREHRDAPMAELEQRVLEAVRAALPRLLEGVILAATTSLQFGKAGIKPACPECGERTEAQSWRQRRVLTVCGRIGFERPWYVCSRCGHNWSPTDQSLQLESRARLSPGMLEWLIHLGASSTSFVEAAGVLDQLTGLTISPETVRLRTEERGALLEEKQQVAIAQVVKTQEPAEVLDQAPGVLVVETDGVQVRYLDGWHEVKLGLVAGHLEGETVAPSYIAARESAEQFGPRLLAEAARRGALEVLSWQGPITGHGLAVLPEVVVLGDGAHWIWNLAEDHFGHRTEIVDFYHASQHLWDVAKALHGEGTPAARTWADQQIRDLLKEGVKPVLQALTQAVAPTSEGAEVLRKEINYFRSNAARMDYPTFRERGLPIGSGAIESAAKHLVQQRLKRPGARWSEPGAQSVLAVRSRIVSRRPLAA
jgi:transposase-like protein